MRWNVEIKTTTGTKKCRMCGKVIYPTEIFCQATERDDYGYQKDMNVHPNCLLNKVINSIHKMKEKEMEKELARWKKMKELMKVIR